MKSVTVVLLLSLATGGFCDEAVTTTVESSTWTITVTEPAKTFETTNAEIATSTLTVPIVLNDTHAVGASGVRQTRDAENATHHEETTTAETHTTPVLEIIKTKTDTNTSVQTEKLQINGTPAVVIAATVVNETAVNQTRVRRQSPNTEFSSTTTMQPEGNGTRVVRRTDDMTDMKKVRAFEVLKTNTTVIKETYVVDPRQQIRMQQDQPQQSNNNNNFNSGCACACQPQCSCQPVQPCQPVPQDIPFTLPPMQTQRVPVTDVERYTVTRIVPATQIVVDEVTRPIPVTEIITHTERVPVTEIINITPAPPTAPPLVPVAVPVTEIHRFSQVVQVTESIPVDPCIKNYQPQPQPVYADPCAPKAMQYPVYQQQPMQYPVYQQQPMQPVYQPQVVNWQPQPQPMRAAQPMMYPNQYPARSQQGYYYSDPAPIAPIVCQSQALCFTNTDCGGAGRCSGAFPGTCNCVPCVNGVSCVDDSHCGGLRGACDYNGRCQCLRGFNQNGFPTLAAATQGLCNNKHCRGTGREDCFGLPCNFGRCICG